MNRLRALDWRFLLAVIPFIAFAASALDTVPIWDARIYAECLVAAPHGQFPQAYLCAGHPTLVFAALGSLLARFSSSYLSLWLVQIALGLLTLRAFYDIARELFPDAPLEVALLTACCGAFPIFVVGAVDINPDFAVTAFFFCIIRALLREKWLQLCIYGIAISFCKETGVLLLLVAIFLHALVFVVRAKGELAARLSLLRRYFPALAGPLLFVLWTLLAKRLFARNALWGGADGESLPRIFTSFSLFDQVFIAQLAAILVLQFAWVPALLALPRWLRLCLRSLFRLESGTPPKLHFIDLLFFATLLSVTRFRTYLNVRYFLPLYPLLLLCAFVALKQVAARSRLALLGALAVAFAVSNFRTVDFASRAVFGTFDFGDHPMLEMTSLTNECCGSGRDQLAYNLEHLELARLENIALNNIYIDALPALAGGSNADWHVAGPIDPRTHRRSLDSRFPAVELLTPTEVIEGKRPARLYYFVFPNLNNRLGDEAAIERWYTLGAVRTLEDRGYKMDMLELTKK